MADGSSFFQNVMGFMKTFSKAAQDFTNSVGQATQFMESLNQVLNIFGGGSKNTDASSDPAAPTTAAGATATPAPTRAQAPSTQIPKDINPISQLFGILDGLVPNLSGYKGAQVPKPAAPAQPTATQAAVTTAPAAPAKVPQPATPAQAPKPTATKAAVTPAPTAPAPAATKTATTQPPIGMPPVAVKDDPAQAATTKGLETVLSTKKNKIALNGAINEFRKDLNYYPNERILPKEINNRFLAQQYRTYNSTNSVLPPAKVIAGVAQQTKKQMVL